ncbi:hypothetical protein D3C76_1343280 [compost metagenome]
MFVKAFGDERRQDLVDTVNGGTAINMAGHLRDDLRGHCGSGGDRLRGFNLGVTHLEAVGQHALQVDQHAVEHREEWRVVEIVVVDLASLMGQHHVTRQDVLLGIVLGDDPGQQIALGGDHLAVFIGVFIEQRYVALLDQAADLLVQPSTQFTRDVAIVTVLNIGPRQLLVFAGHKLVFHCPLDFMDIDARLL